LRQPATKFRVEEASQHVAVVRLILKAALLATALGLILELLVPGSRIIAIGAAVFGVATWIVPPLLMALFGNKKRSSLQSVGFTIYLFVVAACLSAIGVSLALLTLIFEQQANWAWLGLLAIAAFWLLGIISLFVAERLNRRAREVSK
jgi:L-asparagine transporter-like permease